MKSGNVQAKDIQAKIMQVKNVQAKAVQVEDAQLKSVQAQDVQLKNMQTEDIRTEDIRTENIQTEDMQLQNADGGYLSDEELELLIADVEQNDLVAAPPYMAEDVWNRICTLNIKSISDIQHISVDKEVSNDKVKEFRAYCFRVVTSVAAAVMLVFTVPTFMNGQEPDMMGDLESQIEQEQHRPKQREYESREELLGRSSLTEFLNGNSIFGGSDGFGRDKEFSFFK